MKALWNSFLLTFIIGQNIPLFGYAISHNEDSQLKEVTIFVFTSEKDFENMLKNQGVGEKTLKDIQKFMPKIVSVGSFAATAAGNPELAPVIAAIGGGLAAAAKYSAGPLRYAMQQKYNIAIHKHTYRGNKGKDAEWNWADIKKDYGIEPTDPYGLFVAFLNPENKQVLLMTPMKSNAAFGFKAVIDPKTGKLVGQQAPFERDLKELAQKDPSALARLYAYAQNRYDNPHKILWDIKSTFKDVKEKFASFSKKYPDTNAKMEFLGGQLDDLKDNVKNYDSTAGKEDANGLIEFFKREIEAGKKIAADPEAQRLVNRVIAKFNLFNKAIQEIIIKPSATYTAGMEKLEKDREKMKEEAAEEAETFELLGEDYIAPIPNVGLEESPAA